MSMNTVQQKNKRKKKDKTQEQKVTLPQNYKHLIGKRTRDEK